MKNKFNLLLMGAFVCAFSLFASCSSSDDATSEATPQEQPGNGGNNGGGGNTKPNVDGILSGFVRSTNGSAIEGVTVTSGTATTTTDQDGFFTLQNIKLSGKRVVVKFSHYSYADVVRSLTFTAGQTWDIVMTPTSAYWGVEIPSNTRHYPSSNAGNVQVNSESKTMEVDIQADGYKNAETGEAYTGQVTATVTYLNPDAENFADQMPGGDLAAKDKDGKEVQLISYGMSLVDLRGQNGENLQLKSGKPATVTFPVPEGLKNDPRVINHEDIPLWSFNEETGLWEEEGVARYDAEKDAYVGTVTHFSWVNCDYPEVRATIKGTVKDEAGNPIPNMRVYVGQVTAYTNTKGEFEIYVPKDTEVKVWIRSSDYGNYAEDDTKIISTTVQPLAQGAIGTANLVLPTVANISGTIVNNGTGGNVASVWIEYGKDGQTKKVRSDAKGAFKIKAPANYKGEAVVRVRTEDGYAVGQIINLTGKDINVGTITIQTNAADEGQLTFKVTGGETFSVPIDNVGYYEMNGITIVDGNMDVNVGSYRQDHDKYGNLKNGSYMLHEAYFHVDGFSTAQKNYTIDGWQIRLMKIHTNENGEMDGEEWIETSFPEVQMEITLSDNKMKFNIPGSKGSLITWDGDQQKETEMTISGTFTMDLYYEGETVQGTDFSTSDSRIPSFIKSLVTEAPVGAFFVTKSKKLGKGCNIAYGGSLDTFNSLKEKAATLDLKDFSSEFDNGYNDDYKVAAYYKDGKFLKITYNGYNANYGNHSTPYGINSSSAPINIIALDGTMYYVTDLEYFVKSKGDSKWNARKK